MESSRSSRTATFHQGRRRSDRGAAEIQPGRATRPMPTLRRDMESRAARSMSELFVLGLLSRRRDVPVVPVAARAQPVVALHGGRMTSKRIVNVDVGGPAPREKSRVTGPKIRATPRPSRLRDLADRLLRES